jgi:hypothetical protein
MSKNNIIDVLPTLSLESLRDLWLNYKRASDLAKNMQELVNDELRNRYASRVREELNARGREHGEVTIKEDDTSVKVEVRATVKWDNEKLRALYTQHPEHRGLFKVDISVPEKNYSVLPEHIKADVEAARTVTYSEPKPTFTNE